MMQQDLGVPDGIPCPLGVSAQLSDIGRMEQKWFDGEGESYAAADLKHAKQIFESLLAAADLPMPYIYPTPKGTFRAEWNHPESDVIVTIDLCRNSAKFLAMKRGSGDKPVIESFALDATGIGLLAESLATSLDVGLL